MASYHLNADAIRRSRGQSAVAAAAYRARCELVDERTGDRHDYTRARGLLFEGIYAPKNAPEWAHDRAQLWNRAEAADRRKNSAPARDLIIALPHELSLEQNRWALQDFVREQFVRRGLVADVAIHAAHEHGDHRNIHAHVLVTTRTLDGEGFAAGKLRELNDTAALNRWREEWARTANRHLERHGHEARIDHRSLEEQGLDRTPTQHLGKHAMQLERRGVRTAAGDRNRAAEHEAQLTADAIRTRELELADRQRQRGTAENDLVRAAAEIARTDPMTAARMGWSVGMSFTIAPITPPWQQLAAERQATQEQEQARQVAQEPRREAERVQAINLPPQTREPVLAPENAFLPMPQLDLPAPGRAMRMVIAAREAVAKLADRLERAMERVRGRQVEAQPDENAWLTAQRSRQTTWFPSPQLSQKPQLEARPRAEPQRDQGRQMPEQPVRNDGEDLMAEIRRRIAEREDRDRQLGRDQAAERLRQQLNDRTRTRKPYEP